jgi:hypothetical protein
MVLVQKLFLTCIHARQLNRTKCEKNRDYREQPNIKRGRVRVSLVEQGDVNTRVKFCDVD